MKLSASIVNIVLLLLVCGLEFASTQSPCKNGCSGQGRCIVALKRCKCNAGFYKEDCSESLATLLPGAWYTFRGYVIAGHTIIIVLSALALYFSRTSKSTDRSTLSFFNAKRNLLITMIILSVDHILYFAIDPAGFEFILPFGLIRFFFGLIFPLVSTIFLMVLFHWADLYHTTISILKREEMLKKINARYESNITLDSMLKEVKFMHRLKIPFIIFNVLVYVVQLVKEVLFVTRTVVTTDAFQYLWFIYFGVVYLIEAVGFIIYGRRLVSIMPPPLMKKMERITRLICIQAILFLLCWIFVAVAFLYWVRTPWTYITAEFVYRTGIMITLFTILSNFMRKSSKFPYCYVAESMKTSSIDSSGLKGDSMGLDELSLEETEAGEQKLHEVEIQAETQGIALVQSTTEENGPGKSEDDESKTEEDKSEPETGMAESKEQN